jgi:hypothetical protein
MLKDDPYNYRDMQMLPLGVMYEEKGKGERESMKHRGCRCPNA